MKTWSVEMCVRRDVALLWVGTKCFDPLAVKSSCSALISDMLFDDTIGSERCIDYALCEHRYCVYNLTDRLSRTESPVCVSRR
jgi:hypothetical protein